MTFECESCEEELSEITENNECPECGQEYLFNPLEDLAPENTGSENKEESYPQDSANKSKDVSGQKERVQTSVVSNGGGSEDDKVREDKSEDGEENGKAEEADEEGLIWP
jgi:hypothetical protein